ncbi:MAG: spore coat protein [Clostridia bacterium]|nr:spore coat protein [Clostridia bacterium]
MEEKYMVNDILENAKNSITTYSNTITETSNMNLRQTIQNLRNSTESFQYELFKLAESKGYYTPAEDAKIEEINKVKNSIQF